MNIIISNTKEALGKAAAKNGAACLNKAIGEKGSANIIVATGASQFEMLSNLIKTDVDWKKVSGFHLDEYIGISDTHPASFRKYLKERFVDKVPIKSFNYINGESDPEKECRRLNGKLKNLEIDVAFIGIGENAHLAFNDPPANFDTLKPYKEVKLDEDCRRQQFDEGWFKSIDEVPAKAISMSINQILKAKTIICSVPDERKAQAIKGAVEGAISPRVPASILQKHPYCWIYLDKDGSAKKLIKNS